jgi:hypothetical protein
MIKMAGILCFLGAYFIVAACFLPCFFVSADTIVTEEGEEIKGVITEYHPFEIKIATKQGEKIFKKDQIKDIKQAKDEQNLMILADIAIGQKDFTKAYYLYEKVLKLNPDSQKAMDALAEISPKLKGKDSDPSWTGTYERYQDVSYKGKADKQILSDDSYSTQKLQEEFGLILGHETGNIKVLDVLDNTRAERGGLEINDYIRAIEGKGADYMGLYDMIAALLALSDKDKINMTIERKLRLWIDAETTTWESSLWDFTGFSIETSSGMPVVMSVKAGSPAYEAGLKREDIISSIDYKDISSASKDELKTLLQGAGAHYADITIERRLNI